MRFYTGRRNATNKSCLFDAKFFEFEEFSIDTFFCSSIQPQHAVKQLDELINQADQLSLINQAKQHEDQANQLYEQADQLLDLADHLRSLPGLNGDQTH